MCYEKEFEEDSILARKIKLRDEDTSCGVPQENIFGPILFCIYEAVVPLQLGCSLQHKLQV